MNRWICCIVGIWRTLRCGARVDGCDFHVQEENILARVQTLKCEVCGRETCGWQREGLQ